MHADEHPAQLVAHYLSVQFSALEAAGALCADITLVPMANPIGQLQWAMGDQQGRFDWESGENFNRNYADYTPQALAALHARNFAEDADAILALREAIRAAWQAEVPHSAVAQLRHTLQGLALDADIALDLHCDSEAALHLYTAPLHWDYVQPLAAYLGAELALLAQDSGGACFDDACAKPWLAAQAAFPARHLAACVAITVELRGEVDVSHALAKKDAQAILNYLQYHKMIAGDSVALPDHACKAMPLAGSISVVAPISGVVVYGVEVGVWVKKGQALADIVDAAQGAVQTLVSPIEGYVYARQIARFALAGMTVLRVAGDQPCRTGYLLTA